MIKTALIFEIHGNEAYKPNNLLPILNLIHNLIGEDQITYWSIIEKCKKTGGAINSIGGGFPAYELESVANTFYNYSVLNQESIYPTLCNKLNQLKSKNIVKDLNESYEYQKKLRELNEINVLDTWFLQTFKNEKKEGTFEFVKMSDNAIYLRKHGRLQELKLIKTNALSKIYKIRNEPFGWTYDYGNDGNLSLRNGENEPLIVYTKV